MDSRILFRACAGLSLAACAFVTQLAAQGTRCTCDRPQPVLRIEEKQYDLLLKGGHVIDPKNNIDAIRDVAIKDGKIAKVAAGIPANSAIKTVNVTGLYVTPGLIDMHVHVFWGLTKDDYAGGDWAIAPDGVTLRDGVTTVVDAGSSGWRNFETFKERVIDRSQTRVLADAEHRRRGHGQRTDRAEQGRHGWPEDRRDGAEVSGRHRRREERALHRARVAALRRRRSRQARWRTFP